MRALWVAGALFLMACGDPTAEIGDALSLRLDGSFQTDGDDGMVDTFVERPDTAPDEPDLWAGEDAPWVDLPLMDGSTPQEDLPRRDALPIEDRLSQGEDFPLQDDLSPQQKDLTFHQKDIQISGEDRFMPMDIPSQKEDLPIRQDLPFHGDVRPFPDAWDGSSEDLPLHGDAPEDVEPPRDIVAQWDRGSPAELRDASGDGSWPPADVRDASPMDRSMMDLPRQDLSTADLFTGPAEGYVYIPPGSFIMGSPEEELGHWPDESPQHEVVITRGLYMKATEVTQGEWEAVMGENPSYNEGCGPGCPVEEVSWYDTWEYLNSLSDEAGLERCWEEETFLGLKCEGYRLPTEAEWEYAVRAGTTTAFYTGTITNIRCEEPNLDRAGWYCGNADGQTHPVAQKEPNDWGLYDMPGNVYEWVYDWYDEGFYLRSPLEDPSGPSEGTRKVIRGGLWGNDAQHCRSANRYDVSPSSGENYIGFRPARSQVELRCDDGLDNDGDGFGDCRDGDCEGLTCGELGLRCLGGECACPGGAVEVLCSDGVDNDCDGVTDCYDPDCHGPLCPPECHDGEDEDGDGLIDCDDPDCFGPWCPEVCHDGQDNDQDGGVDCEDVDCDGMSCGGGGVRCGRGVCGYVDCGSDLPGYCLVPTGSFIMGVPEDEFGYSPDEGPQHEVTITRDYYLKATEVTQEEWEAIYGINPSENVSCGADCPVEEVTWWNTLHYCNELSERDGLQDCYYLSRCHGIPGNIMYCKYVQFVGLDCEGYRLPTEAEWEYAVRAGTTTAYYMSLEEAGWYAENAGWVPHPVGEKEPNDWGLYDMHGNIREWTWDAYGHDYYATSPSVDPFNSSRDDIRVTRGGSYGDNAESCTSGHRFQSFSEAGSFIIGVRLARTRGM